MYRVSGHCLLSIFSGSLIIFKEGRQIISASTTATVLHLRTWHLRKQWKRLYFLWKHGKRSKLIFVAFFEMQLQCNEALKKNPSSRTIPLNVTAEIAGRRRCSCKLPTLVFKTVRLRSKSSECVFEDDRRQHSVLCSPVPLSGSTEEEGVGGRSWFNGVHLFFAVSQSVKTSGREGKRQYTPGQLSDTGIHLLAARTRKCSANVTRRKCFLHSRS